MIDNQAVDLISQAISDSFNSGDPITFVLFDEHEEKELTRVVTRIDQQLRRFKVESADGWDWIPFGDVIGTR